MRLFLDTANIDHIRHGVRLGIISGVTTNPTLISREGKISYKELIQEICALVPGPVSTEVLAQEAKSMIDEAREISRWAENVVVKIPATIAGVEATSVLSQEKIKVNFTLCFSLNQALLGAIAGATYVSPFVGRLDDIGHNGIELVKEIVEVFSNYNFPAQVIAASLRHARHCIEAAKAGAPIATVPYEVLMQMIRHPLTDLGISHFLADWKRVMG